MKLRYSFPTLTLCFLIPWCLHAQPATPVPRGLPGDLWADVILGHIDPDPVHHPNYAFGDIVGNQAGPRAIDKADSAVVDKIHNILYVFDGLDSRVLAVNLNGPVTSGMGATFVLGQPGFYFSACNGDSNLQNYPLYTVPNASCLCIARPDDQSPGEEGDIGNMDVDSQGNLYVPDLYNNRIVRYDWPTYKGEPASHEWGQPDFSHYQSNQGFAIPSAASLFFSQGSGDLVAAEGGVAIDKWGNLWVADRRNYRILRFPNPTNVPGTAPATTADLVFCQPNFTSNTPSSDRAIANYAQLWDPLAVRVNDAGDVFVADQSGGGSSDRTARILIFRHSGYQTTGSGPVSQPYYLGAGGVTNVAVSASDAITQKFENYPWGLEWDLPVTAGGTGGLWEAEYGEIKCYEVSSAPYTAVKVLMTDQAGNFDGTGVTNPGVFTDQSGGTVPNWHLDNVNGSVGVDASGNLFVVSSTNIQDVWRFPAPIPYPVTGSALSADTQIFQPSTFSTTNSPLNNVGFDGMGGLAVAHAGGTTQVVVSNAYRLMYWNMPANGTSGLTNGKPADGIVGTANPYLHLGTYYMWLTVDHSTQPYLWTTTNPGTGLAALTAFQLPLTNGAAAAASLTAPLPLLGGGQFTWMIGGGGSLGGICTYVDESGVRYLWVSNNGGATGGNRVFRVRDPLNEKGLGPVVDIVLGQPNSTSTVVNYPGGTPTASSLYNPGTIAVDHHGNLFVSDHSFEFTGNARMLRWNKSTIDNTTALTHSSGKAQYLVPADAVYGTNYSFTTTGCYNPPGSWTPPGICGPWLAAFNHDDSFMVVGQNSQNGGLHFPVVFANPTAAVNYDNPVTTLEDFSPQNYNTAFDDDDNLYVSDGNRSRVFIYNHPLFPTLTPTPAPTSTPPCGGGCTPTPTGTPLYCPVTQWGQGVNGVNMAPVGVAVHLQGGVTAMYVADNGNNRILAFSNGAQTGAWTMGSNGKALNSPWEIALNSAGTTLYVADRNNNRVQVFTAAGVAVTALADPVTTTAAGSVIGVGVDSAGNVYATDAANECVWKFTPGGTVTHWFGSPSAFGLPSGIAVDGSDNVYVMDANAPRVYKFTSDGTPLAYWGSNGSGPGQFEQSYSISAGSCGNLYTSDYGLNRMELFDSNGNFLGQFSGTGSGDGQFSNTYFAAVDGLNDLYVAQNGLGVVQEYSPCGLVCGTPTPTVTPTPTALSCGSTASFTVGEPGGVGLDSTGDLYVANGSASLVGVYTSTGGSVTTVGAGSLQAPMGVALDGNANLYVADQALNEVLVYKNVLSPVNPGSLLAQAGSLGSGNGQLDTPTGLALNSAGTTLYVADMGNSRIEDFQIKTTPAWSLTYAGQWGGLGSGGNGFFSSPVGVAVDPNTGTVYVTDADTGLVQVFGPGGNWLNQWDATNGTPLVSANFIAVVPNCGLYVSDGYGSVGIFDLNGNFKGSVEGGSAPFGNTEGIAAGAGGWFVADVANNQVDSFSACPLPFCSLNTFTPTPSATPSPTVSSTQTSTPTQSWTVTPTPSNSATVTPSFTPTVTFTPSSSWTQTTTPSTSATVTPSPTPSWTASSTPTSTPTLTPSTTPTPTWSTTSTWTSTPTVSNTPTLVPTEGCKRPVFYPNPSSLGQIRLHLSPCDLSQNVKLRIYTVVFRKVVDKDLFLPAGPDPVVPLTDNWGHPLANGLYYLVFDTPEGRSIQKLLVLR